MVQPSIPELESVLAVMRPAKYQKIALLEKLTAPRALTVLTGALENRPIVGGDLLKAMRIRRGMTQVDAARVVGISQATLAKWESGIDWPSAERLHSLCFALVAAPEEVTALTVGMFLHSGVVDVERPLRRLPEGLEDLACLTAIAKLIFGASRDPVRLVRLCEWRLCYAYFLVDHNRYEEALVHADAALELAKSVPERRNDLLMASIYRSQALVQRSPKNLSLACAELKTLANQTPASGDMWAWLLADLAVYYARLGRRDESCATARLSEETGMLVEGTPHVWTCAYFARINHLNDNQEGTEKWMALWREKTDWTPFLELRYALLAAQMESKAGNHEEARSIALAAVSSCGGPLVRYRPEALRTLETIMFPALPNAG